MTTFQKIRDILMRALELPAAQRSGFAREACGQDAELLAHVLRKLALIDTGEGILSAFGVEVVLGVGSGEFDIDRPLLPQRIGDYEIRELIGEGGMGIVYRARRILGRRSPGEDGPVEAGEDLALKVIKPVIHSRTVLARFRAEQRVLGALDHPHIARVHDAGETSEGRPYFVMEYVSGPRVTAYCSANALDLRARLELFLPVCRAVEHAHDCGIIHRDLKPPNILVATRDARPCAKIIDFGIARSLSGSLLQDSARTSEGTFLGTPVYAPPEQVLGTVELDVRADVYALGAVLYEILCGAPPIDKAALAGMRFDQLVRFLSEERPPKPSHRAAGAGTVPNGELEGDLDAIVLKAMEKPRERRYARAAELAKDLEAYLAGRPVRASRRDPLDAARRLLRPRGRR